MLSNENWKPLKEFKDIRLEATEDGIAKITINRPEVRNAFRPETVLELKQAFEISSQIGRSYRAPPHRKRSLQGHHRCGATYRSGPPT